MTTLPPYNEDDDALPSFDEMKKMSQEELDSLHNTLFERAISRMPKELQQRERAKQWRRIQELKRIKNPLARAAKANTLMMEGLHSLNDALEPFRSK